MEISAGRMQNTTYGTSGEHSHVSKKSGRTYEAVATGSCLQAMATPFVYVIRAIYSLFRSFFTSKAAEASSSAAEPRTLHGRVSPSLLPKTRGREASHKEQGMSALEAARAAGLTPMTPEKAARHRRAAEAHRFNEALRLEEDLEDIVHDLQSTPDDRELIENYDAVLARLQEITTDEEAPQYDHALNMERAADLLFEKARRLLPSFSV